MTTLSFQVGGTSLDGLKQRLQQLRVGFNPSAQKLFCDPRMTISNNPHSSIIKIQTVADLDLKMPATLPNIFSAAQNQGLHLCSLETAIYLRLFWQDQPESSDSEMHRQKSPDSAVTVASPVISTDPNCPRGFYLRNVNQQLWLRGYICDDSFIWQPEDKFAFQIF